MTPEELAIELQLLISEMKMILLNDELSAEYRRPPSCWCCIGPGAEDRIAEKLGWPLGPVDRFGRLKAAIDQAKAE